MESKKETAKGFLVSEKVMTEVVNFIKAKHLYIDAKPYVDALQSSQPVEITQKSVEPEVIEDEGSNS